MERLEKVFNRQSDFIQETINESIQHNWDGYAILFDSSGDKVQINPEQLTNFTIAWAAALKEVNKSLTVWIGGGGGVSYDNSLLNVQENILMVAEGSYSISSFGAFLGHVTDGPLSDLDP
jgi:hypothetical protein